MLDKVNDGPVLRAEGNAGFDYFDTVKNGYITAKEFSAGAHPGFVLDALDRDGNGKITREEYNADLNADLVFESLNIDGDGHITQTEYNKGFDILDKDKNDFLTRGEFGIDKSKITKRNEFHPVSRADLVFELLDIDGDGHITQTEYNKGFAILDKDQNGSLTRSEFGTCAIPK